MALKRRITVDFSGNKKHRRDIAEGTEVSIKGFEGITNVVVEFSEEFDKKIFTVDASMKVANLQFKDAATATAESNQVTKFFKAHPYLKVEGDDDVPSVIEGWPSQQIVRDPEYKAEQVKARILYVMDSLQSVLPTYEKEDLLVIKRGSVIEVWTKKPFKAGELAFVPHATEVKPRFYTAGRSTIAKNTADPVSKDTRPFVIDGRIRGNPAPDTKSKCALFWLVQRLDTDEAAAKKHINMELKYVSVGIKGTFHIGDKPEKFDVDKSEMPKIAIMTNPKTVAANTRLLVAEDQEVKDLLDQQHKMTTASSSRASAVGAADAKATAKEAKTAVGVAVKKKAKKP